MSTKTAQELCRLAIMLGKCRAGELELAIAEANHGDGPLTVATVTNAIQNLYDDRRKAAPDDAEEAIAYLKARETALGS